MWVDITNAPRRTANLDDWILSDADGHTHTVHQVWLAGHGTVRIHTDCGRDTRTDLYHDRRAYVWDNDGDSRNHGGCHQHHGNDRDHCGGHRH